MPKVRPIKRLHQYTADFKLKAIALAMVKGNRGAGAELSVNEKLIRYWRKQEGELSTCKAGQKSFRGPKCWWPDLENELEEWVGIQRAGGRGVSTTQLRIKAKEMASAKGIAKFRGR